MSAATGSARAPATLQGAIDGGRLMLTAGGAWIADHARALEPQIDAQSQPPRRQTVTHVEIETSRIDQLDTFGAWLIERLMRAWQARGVTVEVTGLPENYRGLVAELHQVKLEAEDIEPRRPLRDALPRSAGRSTRSGIMRPASCRCWVRCWSPWGASSRAHRLSG